VFFAGGVENGLAEGEGPRTARWRRWRHWRHGTNYSDTVANSSHKKMDSRDIWRAELLSHGNQSMGELLVRV
jgi:hypothetical protein